MAFSPEIKSTISSSLSPNGAFIASVLSTKLTIRLTTSLDTERTATLTDPEFASRVTWMRWSPISASDEASLSEAFLSPASLFDVVPSPRGGDKSTSNPLYLLVADEETIRVLDIATFEWAAVITGAGGNLGKLANVEFGRTVGEVLAFSECGVKLTIWSLTNGKNIEIKDPKFMTKGYGYRPISGHFAILSRGGSQDVVTIHAPNTYEILASFHAPTVDAQGLKWSPCGKWIAFWDSPSSGFKLLIYTADGHLYRTYSGSSGEGVVGLGVQTIRWSPRGDFLAVGGHDRLVALLNCQTFSPSAILDHPIMTKLPNIPVWQEMILSPNQRSFTLAPHSMCPPTVTNTASDSVPRTGTSLVAFNNPDGSLIATKNESMPTTVWIWSLKSKKLQTIIVHHSPVRNLMWHPTRPDLLMTICLRDSSCVYLWSDIWAKPVAVDLPCDKLAGRQEAKWINTEALDHSSPMFASGDSHSHMIGQVGSYETEQYPVAGKQSANKTGKLSNAQDGYQESLFKGISGPRMENFGDDDQEAFFDDTFHYRKQAPPLS